MQGYGPRQEGAPASKSLGPNEQAGPTMQPAFGTPAMMLPPQIAVAINFVTHGASLMHPEDHVLYCDDEGFRELATIYPDLHPAHEFAFREACALLAYYFRSNVPAAERERIREEHRDFVTDKLSAGQSDGPCESDDSDKET